MNLAEKYVLNLAIALDELVNAAALLGDPHETISSHVGKLAAQGHPGAELAARAIDVIMLNPQHCAEAAQHEAAIGGDGIIPD